MRWRTVTADDSPSWHGRAPDAAMRAVVLAAEHAANEHADLAAIVVADAESDPRWLLIGATRALVGLVAGPRATQAFEKLRDDTHTLAAETGADDENVRLALAAIAYAQAYERGADRRLEELDRTGEFSDRDVAHAAAVLAGHVVLAMAGDRVGEVFGALRRAYGLGDGGAP